MRKNILILCCFLMSVTGCAKSPSCSDSAVKKLAIEASILPLTKNNNVFLPEVMEIMGATFGKDLATVTSFTDGDFNALRQSKTPQVVDAMKKIDSRMANASIESIRTDSKDDTAKRCDCEAELVLPFDKDQQDALNRKDITLPIKYSAQFTDDGKIVVNVSMQ